MDLTYVPPTLRARVGDDASFELLEMFQTAGLAWKADLLTVDRFERRLSEELGKLRVEMAEQLSATRVDVVKWSFLFWVSQLAAMAALMAFMLRAVGR